jgi:hypothetical protein
MPRQGNTYEGLTDDLLGSRSAVVSDDGLYRYRLDRDLGQAGGRVLFIMLNPSTADATSDDPTIRRCIGFAERFERNLVVVNLYAFRATHPVALTTTHAAGWVDIVGPDNDRYLLEAAGECNLLVAAWGAREPRRGRHREVYELLRPCGPLHALGENANGSPKHPLYVRGDAALRPWSPRDA